jgi:putative transposase
VHLSGANRHDLKGLRQLLSSGLLTPRPEPSEGEPQHLCLDKAYDAEEAERLLEELGYEGHIKRRGQSDEPGVGEPVYPARRWKVERSISWLNNMRKLRVRWEKKAENYRGLWLLAAALIIYRRMFWDRLLDQCSPQTLGHGIIGGDTAAVITPPPGEFFSETNENSVAILLTYGTACVLLAGDAEARKVPYIPRNTHLADTGICGI